MAEDVRASVEREYGATSGLAALGVPLVGAAACARAPRDCDLEAGHLRRPGRSHNHLPSHRARPGLPLRARVACSAAVVPSGSPPIGAGRTALPATGPYVVSHYAPDHEVVLARNPIFQGSTGVRSAGFPDRIVLRLGVSPERQVGLVEVRTGGRDAQHPAAGQARHDRQASPAARAPVLLPRAPRDVHEHAPGAVRPRRRAAGGQLRGRPLRDRQARGGRAARPADLPGPAAGVPGLPAVLPVLGRHQRRRRPGAGPTLPGLDG